MYEYRSFFHVYAHMKISSQSGMFRKDGSHDGVPLLPLQLHSGAREKKRRGLPDAKWMIMLVVEYV